MATTGSVSMSDIQPTAFYPQGQPPHTGHGTVISSQVMGMHVIQPNQPGTTVLVTQPVVTVPAPQVTCAIVWSTLSTIFCCCICGITGILIALKGFYYNPMPCGSTCSWERSHRKSSSTGQRARLYVVQKRYEEARHALSFVWLFLGLAIFFGIITWIVVVWYCLAILPGQISYSSGDNHYYRN